LGRAGTQSNRIELSAVERGVAVFGLLVGIVMLLMKIVPLVPGHFTGYEWLALAIWVALGTACMRKQAVVEKS
jgi:small basic protein